MKITSLNPQEIKTILLVEDETDIRLLYSEVLIDAGYNVIQAKDGAEAREKIQNEHWDLLLLDIILPEEDGLQLLKEFYATSYVKDKPVYLLTNLNNDNVILQSKEMGAAGYIVKSDITPDQVVRYVDKALK